MVKIADYVKETRQELKHVSWPTRRQAVAFTLMVIILSLVTSIFLGVFDAVFSRLLNILI